jgi:hypothetical protein
LTSGSAPARGYSDEAKRASDIINSYRTFIPWDELRNKWLAIRLSDGGHDGTLYDSKRDAVRHQSDEFLCAYVCFRNLIRGSSPREMELFLKFNRDAYDSGFRLPDPDADSGGPEVLMTTALRDFYRNQGYR